MITILNKHHGHQPGDRNIYIGRGSPLGNPFRISADSPRDSTIARYETYLKERIAADDPTIINALNNIAERAQNGDVGLICFCSPRPCHGDVIKRIVETAIEESNR
jgi:hypothetical protein